MWWPWSKRRLTLVACNQFFCNYTVPAPAGWRMKRKTRGASFENAKSCLVRNLLRFGRVKNCKGTQEPARTRKDEQESRRATQPPPRTALGQLLCLLVAAGEVP